MNVRTKKRRKSRVQVCNTTPLKHKKRRMSLKSRESGTCKEIIQGHPASASFSSFVAPFVVHI